MTLRSSDFGQWYFSFDVLMETELIGRPIMRANILIIIIIITTIIIIIIIITTKTIISGF